MSYTDFPAEQMPTKKQTALERINVKLSNAVSPALSATKQIEEKLHAILNLNYPQNTVDKEDKPDPREFRNGGAISQIEENVLLAHEVTDRLEKILKHLSEII